MANSPARGAVDVGSVIADTYTIEALLGRGGMGSVFLASHKRLAGKRVAIKILHTELEDADVVARFKREAEIAAKLNHPNIVGVIDYNVAPDGMPYLVLDYLEGETLAQAIARGPMALEQVLSIMRQVGSALAAAHRAGIVHRDLKPQNIFLVPTEIDGREVEIAKVLDFGISKIRGSQTVKTQEATLLGTPQYMAPEQALGQHANVDERTDVFALGAIVYEMLSGKPAFAGASIPEVVFKVVYEQPTPLAQQATQVPPAIVAAVDKAMAKASDERFATVAGFVEALTGQPLSVTRGQAAMTAASSAALPADAPSGAKRVTSNEAFDRTMGPGAGEAAGAPVVATAATGAPGTLLGTGRPALAPVAPTLDLSSADGKPRRSAGVIAAIALAGAAVAAGAVYLVMRTPEHRSRPRARTEEPARREPAGAPPERVSVLAPPPPAPPDAKTAEPGPPDAKPEPAPPAPVGTTPTDVKPPVVPVVGKPDVKPPVKPHRPEPRPPVLHPPVPPPPPDHEAEADDDIRDKLKQAATALEHHEYDLAERLANAVINSAAAPKQRATARMIHGQVQCIARNDQEGAQIDLRNLENFRALRMRLLNVCRNHGVLGGP
jgi:eukaryotic-like serine/threonine-protein kinase